MRGSQIKSKILDSMKNGKPLDVYDAYGQFLTGKLYQILFDDLPNNTNYAYEGIDCEVLNGIANRISEKYGENEYFSLMKSDVIPLIPEDEPNTSDIISVGEYPIDNNNKSWSHYRFILQNLIIDMKSSTCVIYYTKDEKLNEGVEIISELIDFVKKNNNKNNKPLFKMVCNEGHGYFLKEFESKNYDINIDETYNDDFKNTDKDIKEFLDNDSSGLIILHGLQGTGKTTYIRHLMSYTNKTVMYMNAQLIDNLDSPSFLSFLSEHKNSIIIAEDSEELLRARCSGGGINSGIVNILNISDGILGDVFQIKFICTFNANLSEIDKALQRKGRLKARYEFKELKADKVKSLSKKYNLGIPDEGIKDMSLSDIFNYESGDFSVKTNKIGLCK